MGKYEARLSDLTQADIIARLEGPGGLLALTSRELFYLDDQTQQSARLSQIKRIGVNKQTGNVDVVGEQGTMMEIAPIAFQKDELKLFLESLKGHVLKAKSEPTQVIERPKTVEQAPAAPASPPFPKFEEPVATPSAPIAQPPNPTPLEMPAPVEVEPAPSGQINIAEPPKTLPDEPSDSIWAYDGSPKPSAAPAVAEPLPTPVPSAPASQGHLTVPPVAPIRTLSSTQRIISALLKVSALITAVVTVGYLVVNMGTTSDIWVPLGVIAIGLSLSLIQWRLSEPY
ncbi:hypothetical protein [Meiothermus hypogaeus]|uniref:Uncharacterized protein n=2 Tax=Meiothermus hypogaeus TaxID=884155 RepID=A0A511R2G3_9DEIN|nr:hypothetical protein [Meiothermus hypogaeus]RIH74893.1 hypothetical protein Mhypo_03151 [Meiothermus hypogaeus]GEM83801.1 hypothetical protein MHY01S_19670 [Meiothermus hypogaeus NBRC 106114]GIW36246.1 MAG: hypothetical protein KatS3mg073_0391 [Meiothermus sp.]